MGKIKSFRDWLESTSVEDAVLGVAAGGAPLGEKEKSHLMSRKTTDFSSEIRRSIKNLGVVKSVAGRGLKARIFRAVDEGIAIYDLIRMISGGTIREDRYESDIDAMARYADVSREMDYQQPDYLSNHEDFVVNLKKRGMSMDEIMKSATSKFGASAADPKARKTLVIMRGVSGSGKSTMAKRIATEKGGVVLSTDDFFEKDGRYEFDPKMLPLNHRRNQTRAEDAMRSGVSPIIIDNTNTEAWEMRPYVKAAIDNGYEVQIVEPGSEGFPEVDFDEIMRRQATRGSKSLPAETVKRMMSRFKKNLTVQDIMDAKSPVRP